jgi:hypothetical protein
MTHDAERPLLCPACGSTELTTTSKSVNSSTYWLCGKCGEVWNAGRRQERNGYSFRYGLHRR